MQTTFAGTTRFEDRYRLPLGQIVSFNHYTAKILSLVAFDPRILLAYASFGDVVDIRVRLVATLADLVGWVGMRARVFWKVGKTDAHCTGTAVGCRV